MSYRTPFLFSILMMSRLASLELIIKSLVSLSSLLLISSFFSIGKGFFKKRKRKEAKNPTPDMIKKKFTVFEAPKTAAPMRLPTI